MGSAHLTDEQFGALLARWPPQGAGAELALAEAHLLGCAACAAELARLRESIALFREASSAYADAELRRIPRWIPPDRRVLSHTMAPAYWVAAAAMLLTAVLPLQVLRRHAVAPRAAVAASAAASVAMGDTASAAQSDEALLDDVNREISATLPAPMQALADTTAAATATASGARSNPVSDQGASDQGASDQGALNQRKDQP